jgi:hypothetical protein
MRAATSVLVPKAICAGEIERYEQKKARTAASRAKIGCDKNEGGRPAAPAVEVGDRPSDDHGKRGGASEAWKCGALQNIGREAVSDGIHE